MKEALGLKTSPVAAIGLADRIVYIWTSASDFWSQKESDFSD